MVGYVSRGSYSGCEYCFLVSFDKKYFIFKKQLIFIFFQLDHHLMPELVDVSEDDYFDEVTEERGPDTLYGMYGFESREEAEDFFIYVTPPDSSISFLLVVISGS